jgi:aquaporin Z
MKKYLAEFIGTFFLVLTIGMCVIEPGGAGNLAPIAIGTALMVMIYAGGHISGAHFNPAVTVGVWIRGKCARSDVAGYFAAQFLAAVAAALAVLAFKGNPQHVTPGEIKVVPALCGELIGTFALVYVILNVATSKDTAGNSNYGLAIGFTVMAMAYAFSAASGAVFNPAVAVGITIMHLAKASNLWIYFAAEVVAAALAAAAFLWMNPHDK